jgi:hypothetical protein
MRGIVEKAELRGFESKEQAVQAVQHFLALQRSVCARLKAVIARVNSELPEFSTEDLETMLTAVSREKVRISQFAEDTE